MYENMTFEFIMKRVLSQVSRDTDKRQGSVIYDALAPACAEITQLYIELDRIIKETFADTSSRKYLIMRAKERGIKPYEAVKAVLKGRFNIDIPIGARFCLNDVYYKSIEKISSGLYKMECETAGKIGNYEGTLIPVDNIDGLTYLVIEGIIIYGEDEEETEKFRKRYFESFGSQAFGGNRKDYIEKVNAIAGVGGCKIYRAPEGGGSVKVIIINSEYKKPDLIFIEQVQNYIDPETNKGEGMGIAPIGHTVIVEGVKERRINFIINLDYNDDIVHNKDIVKKKIENAINKCISEISSKWADSNKGIRVNSYEIGMNIQNLPEIRELYNIKLNPDIYLNDDEIPALGDIEIKEGELIVN